MSYTSHFQHADDVVAHLNTIVRGIGDPLLKAKYTGFLSVSAVTTYELAVKTIFIEFAQIKHAAFGGFASRHFDKINGRIRINNLKDDYIKKFGDKYLERFEKKLKKERANYLAAHKRDAVSSYANLIEARNKFAHGGQVSANSTYEETVRAYEDGKLVLKCLAESMRR